MRKVIQQSLNMYAHRQIKRLLPDAVEDLDAYKTRSNTTGTQWFTLWLTVRNILKHKHRIVLECGTGSSTIILAAALLALKQEDPSFDGRLVSMESVPEWYEIAAKNLPEKYAEITTIVLGPREKFEFAMFRGYVHSNIPTLDYDFVLLDGPAFQDENGIAFCADAFRAMELSSRNVIHGVADGRASSVFVMQQIFGVAAARYWHGCYAAAFRLPRIDFRDADLKTTRDFSTSVFGRLGFRKFRR